jgi:hypothetical protein
MLSMSHRAPGYRLNSHVPPTFSAISSTRVRTPSSRSRCSAYRPEKPAPVTIASKRTGLGVVTSRHLHIRCYGSYCNDYSIRAEPDGDWAISCRFVLRGSTAGRRPCSGQSFLATSLVMGGLGLHQIEKAGQIVSRASSFTVDVVTLEDSPKPQHRTQNIVQM